MNWWTQNGWVDPIGSNLEALRALDDQFDADEPEAEPLELNRQGLNTIRAHVRCVLLGERWIKPEQVRAECHAVSLVADDATLAAEFDEYQDAMAEMEAHE